MKSEEIREKFLKFFEKRGHSILPSASLVPEEDASVLFITAGMQPLVPYLLGTPHPQGQRVANIQKCVRTQDIDDIGDATHNTFFEMLGNWSIGNRDADDGIGENGYFKDESIRWSYEFLTSKEEGLGLDPDRIYITCFEGNEDAPRDEESANIWKSVGIPEERIFFMGADDNWWSPGDNGPSGPDTEMFYDISPQGLEINNKDDFKKADDEDQLLVEIWNNVFMEYEKSAGKVIGKLAQKNVDTGAGFERLAMVMQGVDNTFETDLFAPLMRSIEEKSYEFDLKSTRIVADHIRTAVFMIADGVLPSNTDKGYVLRRLIRRAVRHADKLGIEEETPASFAQIIIEKYGGVYENLKENESEIIETIEKEGLKFRETLKKGLKEFEKISGGNISGEEAFDLYQTYGFPIELTEELAKEKGVAVDIKSFESSLKEHQEKSREGAEKKFKGGLGDTTEMSVKYHTATHLLHQALRDILGEHVEQRGSNITPERLRFDFSHPEKLTDDEKGRVEELVNKKIEEGLDVFREEMTLDEAKSSGALGIFGEKYGDRVSVYTIGKSKDNYFSKEICGGPHVENTKDLGRFRIKKEESSSAGVRRIKAVLD